MSRSSPLTQPTQRRRNPGDPIDARPPDAIYEGNQRIGYQNRDGTRSPIVGLGGTNRPLSQPMPRMKSKPAVSPEELSAQKAQFTWDFNQRNPHLHMDSITGHTSVHPQAEARVKEWKAAGRTIGNGERIAPQGSSGAGNNVPLDGKGGYAKSGSPLMQPSSTAGQAQSMRESMAPNAGEDRYGRTSESPSAGGKPVAPSSPLLSSSARGDWQQGDPNTRFRSDQYGAGSSKITTPADRAANAANAIGSTGGGMSGVVAAGVSAATSRPSAPILPSGVGAASTRSPGTPITPTSPQMAGKQPAYTPKPSAVPAEDLKRYADAYEKVKAQDAAKSAQNAANQPTLASESGTIKGIPPIGTSPLTTPTGRPPITTGAPTSTGTINAGNPSIAGNSTAPSPTPVPTPSAASAPATSASTQPIGPSEQEIQAQANKAAASQRGYVGNAAVKVGTSAVTAAGNAVSAVNNAAAAVPKLADQMVEGAKKGFTQMGKDAFGTNAPTAETQKYGEMLDKETAARNAARGFDDAADLARFKAQDAASGTSPLMQPSNTPQGGSQMADAAAAEEEARRLKEQELASAE